MEAEEMNDSVYSQNLELQKSQTLPIDLDKLNELISFLKTTNPTIFEEEGKSFATHEEENEIQEAEEDALELLQTTLEQDFGDVPVPVPAPASAWTNLDSPQEVTTPSANCPISGQGRTIKEEFGFGEKYEFSGEYADFEPVMYSNCSSLKRKRNLDSYLLRQKQHILPLPPRSIVEIQQYYDNRHVAKGPERTAHSKYKWIRNFNNWAKRCLISEALFSGGGKSLTVADFCCGVGGDLQKYKGFGVDMYIGLDISKMCIRRAKERYEELRHKTKIDYRGFFFECDLSRPLEDSLYPPEPADLVSCMFGIHYFFEHDNSLHDFLLNVSRILRTSGKFIGIVPDAAVITRRIRKSVPGGDKTSIQNGLYRIQVQSSTQQLLKRNAPIRGTGIRYSITLEASAQPNSAQRDVLFDTCNEFLVPRPVLESVAQKFDLRLILWENLQSFFYNRKEDELSLMEEMHVKNKKISFDEWELVHLYSAFMFEKM